jgi:SAM-dependent methyltransferase
MSNFQNYSKYYDLLYKDKNYKEESDYIIKTIEKFSPKTKTILELGCGSGSHAEFLCQSGFQVTGIERSKEMVDEVIKKNINNFSAITGDIVTTELSKKFDTVISLFHVISYLTSNEDLLQCFKKTHNHLNDNGIFIFDVWYSPAVYLQKPETRIKRLENNNIEVIRIAESDMLFNENVVNVNYQILIKDKNTNQMETINELHPMRHFSIPEIKLLAKLSNFELIHKEEFLTKNEPSEDTWGVCFILKKI